MMSDQEFIQLSEEISPLTNQLHSEIEILKSKGLNKNSWVEIQRLIKELAPYEKNQPALTDWIKEINQELGPFWEEMDVLRKTIFINLLILVILALVPLMASLFGADQMVVLILCLPILGWGWFGFRGYLKKQKII